MYVNLDSTDLNAQRIQKAMGRRTAYHIFKGNFSKVLRLPTQETDQPSDIYVSILAQEVTLGAAFHSMVEPLIEQAAKSASVSPREIGNSITQWTQANSKQLKSMLGLSDEELAEFVGA